MSVDINDAADHINASIEQHALDIGNLSITPHAPVQAHINNTGITINGIQVHDTPILSMTATPATEDAYAYITVQFAIGALTVDPAAMTAAADEAGVITFGIAAEHQS
ncbi:hypothetical protein HQO42_14995 [Rhodococcus fascians]|nr:hypothetical protein [Rhodococcus fascians]MBY4237761.1 hypothetical protein [Rhodococcus fascians]MBY4253964.1 hypothetical protein [Rhodococcus fascians]MBY4269165.1 hypothetical protein [Rhodococcus fascians]